MFKLYRSHIPLLKDLKEQSVTLKRSNHYLVHSYQIGVSRTLIQRQQKSYLSAIYSLIQNIVCTKIFYQMILLVYAYRH